MGSKSTIGHYNPAGLVNRYIGSAYDTVKNVSDNLTEILLLEDLLSDLTYYVGVSTIAPETRLSGSDVELGDYYYDSTLEAYGYAVGIEVVSEVTTITWAYLDLSEFIAIAAAAQVSADEALVSAQNAKVSEDASEVSAIASELSNVQSKEQADIAEAFTITVEANKLATDANVVITNNDVMLTNANRLITNADKVATNADVVLTNNDAVLTNNNVQTTNSDAIATAADKLATNADVVATNNDVTLTNADVITAGNSASQAGTSADYLLNMTAEATSLPPSQEPTATYNTGTGVLSLGIPANEALPEPTPEVIIGSSILVSKDLDLVAEGYVDISLDVLLPKIDYTELEQSGAFASNEGTLNGFYTAHSFTHDQSFQITEGGLVAYLNAGYTSTTGTLFICDSWSDETPIHQITFNDAGSTSSDNDTALIGRVRFDESTNKSFIHLGFYNGTNHVILTVAFSPNETSATFAANVVVSETIVSGITAYKDDYITVTNNFMIFNTQYVPFNADGTPNFSLVKTFPSQITNLNIEHRNTFTMNDMLVHPASPNTFPSTKIFFLASDTHDDFYELEADDGLHTFTIGLGGNQINYISAYINSINKLIVGEIINDGGYVLLQDSVEVSCPDEVYSIWRYRDNIINGGSVYKRLGTSSDYNYLNASTQTFDNIYNLYNPPGGILACYQNDMRGSSFNHFLNDDYMTMFTNNGDKTVIKPNIISSDTVLIKGKPAEKDKKWWCYTGKIIGGGL